MTTTSGKRSTRRAPGPSGKPILGCTADFARQPLDFCLRAAREYGDISTFFVIPDRWYLVTHPDHIWDVLVTRANIFNKPRLNKRIFELFLGNGLLSSDGHFWRRQHNMVKPAFHKKRIDAYGQVMVQFTKAMLDGWKDGERREISAEMTGLTMSIVAKTLFDADAQGEAQIVGDAMLTLNEVLVDHIHLPLPVPTWWPSKTNKRKLGAIANVERIVGGIIQDRKRTRRDRGDLLSSLVLAQSESGEHMNDKELRDEAMTLFFAGHETTAISLAWLWYLLAKHPDVETKLCQELDRQLAGRAITPDDLAQLPYLDMVVKEGMRILPSVWSYMREPTEDFDLGPYRIEKGSIVFICPYVTQHDPRFFEAPETFWPERFLPENEKAIHKGAYLPFGGGPRICIGKAFAGMEARLVLATMLQHIRLELAEDYRHELLPQLTLRPKHGLPMYVRTRARKSAPATSGDEAARATPYLGGTPA